ncbi:MAG: DUF6998 domain-containing protein [Alphaproteobacteria bacterium]
MSRKEEFGKVEEEEAIEKMLVALDSIYKAKEDIRNNFGIDKTFALGGRFLGDVGECLVSYLFDVQLYNTQKPGRDGVKGDIPVEIKVRTRNSKNKVGHIHISADTRKEPEVYLIVLSLEFCSKKDNIVHIEINSKVSAKWFTGNKLGLDGGFIDFKILKEKCVNKGIDLKNKIPNIRGWKIEKDYD